MAHSLIVRSPTEIKTIVLEEGTDLQVVLHGLSHPAFCIEVFLDTSDQNIDNINQILLGLPTNISLIKLSFNKTEAPSPDEYEPELDDLSSNYTSTYLTVSSLLEVCKSIPKHIVKRTLGSNQLFELDHQGYPLYSEEEIISVLNEFTSNTKLLYLDLSGLEHKHTKTWLSILGNLPRDLDTLYLRGCKLNNRSPEQLKTIANAIPEVHVLKFYENKLASLNLTAAKAFLGALPRRNLTALGLDNNGLSRIDDGELFFVQICQALPKGLMILSIKNNGFENLRLQKLGTVIKSVQDISKQVDLGYLNLESDELSYLSGHIMPSNTVNYNHNNNNTSLGYYTAFFDGLVDFNNKLYNTPGYLRSAMISEYLSGIEFTVTDIKNFIESLEVLVSNTPFYVPNLETTIFAIREFYELNDEQKRSAILNDTVMSILLDIANKIRNTPYYSSQTLAWISEAIQNDELDLKSLNAIFDVVDYFAKKQDYRHQEEMEILAQALACYSAIVIARANHEGEGLIDSTRSTSIKAGRLECYIRTLESFDTPLALFTAGMILDSYVNESKPDATVRTMVEFRKHSAIDFYLRAKSLIKEHCWLIADIIEKLSQLKYNHIIPSVRQRLDSFDLSHAETLSFHEFPATQVVLPRYKQLSIHSGTIAEADMYCASSTERAIKNDSTDNEFQRMNTLAKKRTREGVPIVQPTLHEAHSNTSRFRCTLN